MAVKSNEKIEKIFVACMNNKTSLKLCNMRVYVYNNNEVAEGQ